MSQMNHFHLSGAVLFGTAMGDVCGVTPVAIPGGTPHVVIYMRGGARIELTSAAAAELARRLPEALASLPDVPDCGGAAWTGGGDPL
jgi:hypothetical protein